MPAEQSRLARFQKHFGLTKTPKDIGDDGQAFIDFVDSVIRADEGPLSDLFDDLLGRIEKTGLTGPEVTGRLIDILIVDCWGEAPIAN